MNLDLFGALSRYNRWMNEKVYDACATLTDEARKLDRGAFFKSIHGTLNHLLVADRVWLGRFTAAELADGWIGPGGIRTLDQQLYPDFAELRSERAKTDEELASWVSALDAEILARPLLYPRQRSKVPQPLWASVIHLFNHQTHHRGQITTLLTQAGRDPGVTDLVAMLRDEAARSSE